MVVSSFLVKRVKECTYSRVFLDYFYLALKGRFLDTEKLFTDQAVSRLFLQIPMLGFTES